MKRDNNRVLINIFFLGLLTLSVAACGNGEEDGGRQGDSAYIVISSGTSSVQSLTTSGDGKSLQHGFAQSISSAALPPGIDRLVVSVTDQEQNEIGSGTLQAGEESLRIRVLPHIVMNVEIEAYEGSTLRYEGTDIIPALYPGQSYPLNTTLTEVVRAKPLTLTNTFPQNGANDVPADISVVRVFFEEEFSGEQVTSASLTLSVAEREDVVFTQYSVVAQEVGTAIEFTVSDLTGLTTYDANVAVQLDQGSGPVNDNEQWSFTTAQVVVTKPLTLSSTAPAANAQNVPNNLSSIRLLFKESFTNENVTSANLTLSAGENPLVFTEFQVNSDDEGSEVVFTVSNLAGLTTYDATAIINIDQGNGVELNQEKWFFSTGFPVGVNPLTLLSSFPDNGAQQVNPDAGILRLDFEESLQASKISSAIATVSDGVNPNIVVEQFTLTQNEVGSSIQFALPALLPYTDYSVDVALVVDIGFGPTNSNNQLSFGTNISIADIQFADPNLQQCFDDNVAAQNSGEGGIVIETAADMTVLDCGAINVEELFYEISDLTGIGILSNLANLNLHWNILDNAGFAPISELTKLTALNISNPDCEPCIANEISDLSPLQGMTTLQKLDISFTPTSSFAPLANLTNLQEFSAIGLRSVNIRPLTVDDGQLSQLEGLENLQKLDLSRNQFKDISSLSNLVNLAELNMESNDVMDLSVLSGVTTLSKINFRNNRIEKIDALLPLINLRVMDMSLNNIKGIPDFSAFTQLTDIDLSQNNISDVSALGGLTSIERIDLSTNALSAGIISRTEGDPALSSISSSFVGTVVMILNDNPIIQCQEADTLDQIRDDGNRSTGFVLVDTCNNPQTLVGDIIQQSSPLFLCVQDLLQSPITELTTLDVNDSCVGGNIDNAVVANEIAELVYLRSLIIDVFEAQVVISAMPPLGKLRLLTDLVLNDVDVIVDTVGIPTNLTGLEKLRSLTGLTLSRHPNAIADVSVLDRSIDLIGIDFRDSVIISGVAALDTLVRIDVTNEAAFPRGIDFGLTCNHSNNIVTEIEYLDSVLDPGANLTPSSGNVQWNNTCR